ncbi:hypothetical protein [Streptomyces sp. G45]|uniref:hypothetical protein n=1 Tax=Streptomyces sp. G45 TaxID=3406627 RepID=UPI003C23FC9E
MRLSPRAAAGTAAAAALLVPALAGAPALAHAPSQARQPVCAAPVRSDFPLDARIREGPAVYHPGGGYRSWTVRLSNATRGVCRSIHPVVVLVDDRGELRSGQIRMEFHDGARWRPVRFERTARAEHVGVFDDGFGGFTAGPGETVTVRVRLAFRDGTAPDRVVASAAVVQRRGDDGDWVGESGDYSFDIRADGGRPWAAPGELAMTGPGRVLGTGHALGLGAAALALVLGGGALVAGARRLGATGS